MGHRLSYLLCIQETCGKAKSLSPNSRLLMRSLTQKVSVPALPQQRSRAVCRVVFRKGSWLKYLFFKFVFVLFFPPVMFPATFTFIPSGRTIHLVALSICCLKYCRSPERGKELFASQIPMKLNHAAPIFIIFSPRCVHLQVLWGSQHGAGRIAWCVQEEFATGSC